jgi:hypothetical protein
VEKGRLSLHADWQALLAQPRVSAYLGESLTP